MAESPSASVEPVGRSIPRVDGRDKVTGAARYIDDLPFPEAWQGVTVRTTMPHGTLDAIELSDDFDWSQVTVVTAEDIDGENVIALMERDQPALVPVGGTVMHCDEPVALIAAPTLALAREARGAVVLKVTPRPHVPDIDAALEANTTIRGNDNVFRRFEINKGDVARGFEDADVVVEGEYRTGAQEQMYIEPQGVASWWDEDAAGKPRVHIRGSMQCPYYIHAALKELFQLPDDRVVIGQTVTGGGFGGKEEYPSILSAHAALLARKAARPVKLIYDRPEDIGATTKRHPSLVKHKMGLKKDGTVTAIEVDVVVDGGAYLTLTPVVLSRAVLHAAGPYRCDNTHVVGRAVATNSPPHGAYRGFGAPQVTFAYERQMEKAARALGLEPMELRRRTMLREGDTTATKQVLKYSVGSAEVLDAVTRQLDEPPPTPHSHLAGSDPAAIKRGRGVAFYYHGAGFTGRGEERLKGKVAVAAIDDPDTPFEVRSASTDIGQGVLTIFTQMAATTLGVDIDKVRISAAETDRVPDSGPTVASRTCMVVGSVVQKAAEQLKTTLLAHEAARGLDTDDIVAVVRAVVEAGGELEELATYESPPGINFDEDTYEGDAYPVFGWACCVAEVAVDTDTYEVAVERLIHAVDVGKAINPVIVEGQIEGGTLQSLGWALWESVQYIDGRVDNRRMTDSIIPTAMEAPEMETLVVEVPYPYGPHGAKGVGEIPMDGPAAAVANALEDAMGKEMKSPPDSLPLLPEIIRQLTRGGAGRFWR